MKTFFKNIMLELHNLPAQYKTIIIILCVVFLCFSFKKAVSTYYNKDKIKFLPLPIIAMAFWVGLILLFILV